jgi:hypothetical protein
VDAVYSLYGLGRACGVGEEHAPGEPHRLEEPLDGGSGQPPREEQPVHSLYGRELCRPTGEEQGSGAGARSGTAVPIWRGLQLSCNML